MSAKMWTALLAGLSLLLAMAAVTPASAQVPVSEAEFDAYATGAAIHAEGLEQPTLQDPTSFRVVDSEVAFSGATVDSTGLNGAKYNEYGALVQPEKGTSNSYGRGYGLDVAITSEGGTDDPLLRFAGLAEATAPPTEGPVINEIGPVDADPLAYASVLRGGAYAAWEEPDPCIIGRNFSSGLGYAAETELVDQDGAADETASLEQPVLSTGAGDEAAVRSLSRNYLDGQVNAQGEPAGNALALVAETRQEIAPVTFFEGTPNQFTIEVLPVALRAHAGGTAESSFLHYGPADESPNTPVVRITTVDDQGNEVVEGEFTTQQVFGDEGLIIEALPLAEIAIGEDPRAIGGGAETQPTVTPTTVSGAVDVVRVRLLSDDGTGEASEVRIGHMEVAATVPAGGLTCPLPVEKVADTQTVAPGDTFTYVITITNPYDCRLTDVHVVDSLTADPGVIFSVDGSTPPADLLSDNEIVWNDVGPIEPGASKELTLTVTIGADSGPGQLVDVVDVTALCDGVPLAGGDLVASNFGTPASLSGNARVDGPTVAEELAVAAGELPATGGIDMLPIALLALGGAAVIRRVLRSGAGERS